MTVPLRCDRLTKTFGTTRAVDQVTLDIEPGELFFLLGPSGIPAPVRNSESFKIFPVPFEPGASSTVQLWQLNPFFPRCLKEGYSTPR